MRVVPQYLPAPRHACFNTATPTQVAEIIAAGPDAHAELIDLVRNPVNKNVVREAGAIPVPVQMLPASLEQEEVNPLKTRRQSPCSVINALWSLAAQNEENQDAIRQAGGVPRLVAQLQNPGTSAVAGHAAGALWSLAANNPSNQHAVRESGGVTSLIDLAHACSSSTWSPDAARHAAGALRNLAADNPENKESIRRLGGIPPLVKMLHAGAASLAAQQAAGALANLASNTQADQDAIRDAGGIPPLVMLLRAGAASRCPARGWGSVEPGGREHGQPRCNP